MKLKLKLDVKEHEMSSEEKVREQNCIHQLAFKLHQKMPRDFKSYQMVVEHLMRNTHRYNKMDEDMHHEVSDMKMKEICDISVKKEVESNLSPVKTMKLCKMEQHDPCKDVNKKLHQIRALKRQNRITEQQNMVGELKKKLGTYQ